VDEEVRDHQRADRAQDEPRVEVPRDQPRLDDGAPDDRPADHEQDDQVHHVDQEVQRLVQERRQQRERDARPHARHDDVGGGDRDDQKTPEDEQVVLAGAVLRAFLGDLLLTEEVDADIDEALGQLVEARARIGSTGGDRASEQPHRAREERDRRREQEDEQGLGHDVSEISRTIWIVMAPRGLTRIDCYPVRTLSVRGQTNILGA
jgi:hypothetical protein